MITDVIDYNIKQIEQFFGGTKCYVKRNVGKISLQLYVSKIELPTNNFGLIEIIEYIRSNKSRGLFLGKDALGARFLPLQNIVHALITGSSGFGKSSTFKSLLTQTILFQENVVNFIIDPKRIDYSFFKKFENVATVTETQNEWTELITLILIELTVREFFFAKSFMDAPSSIEDYWLLREKFESSHLPQFSRIFVWIDEFHMINNINQRNFWLVDAITKITKKGRALGIHLILSSQSKSDVPHSIRDQATTVFEFYSNSINRIADEREVNYRKELHIPTAGKFLFADDELLSFTSVHAPLASNEDIIKLLIAFGKKKRAKNKNYLYPLSFPQKNLKTTKMLEQLIAGIGLESFLNQLRDGSFDENQIDKLHLCINSKSNIFPTFHKFT